MDVSIVESDCFCFTEIYVKEIKVGIESIYGRLRNEFRGNPDKRC